MSSAEKNILLIRKTLETYSYKYLNKPLFESIYKDNSIIRKTLINKRSSTEAIDNDFNFFGLSIHEIAAYLAPQVGGIQMSYYRILLQKLEEHDLIIRQDPLRSNNLYGEGGIRFQITHKGLTTFLNNTAENIIMGFNYIYNRYKNSLVRVLGKIKGSEQIGTAFIIRNNDRFQLATCMHNIEMENLTFLSNDDKILTIRDEIKYHKDKRDIVLIDFKEQESISDFFLIENNFEILQNIITMGYPTVPMTSDAYLLAHKGEINSIAQSYHEKGDYIIFSAKTSSGNSGSPLINEFGHVIGMITNEFFNQQDYIEKGKPPYFAAIPISEIENIS